MKILQKTGTVLFWVALGSMLILGGAVATLLVVFFGGRQSYDEPIAKVYVTHIRDVLSGQMQGEPFEYGDVTLREAGVAKTPAYQTVVTCRKEDFSLHILLSSGEGITGDHYEITAEWETEREENIRLIGAVDSAIGRLGFTVETYETLKEDAVTYHRKGGYTQKYDRDAYATYAVTDEKTSLFISGAFKEDFRYAV